MISKNNTQKGCLPLIAYGSVLINSILILGLVLTEWIYNDQSYGSLMLAAVSLFWTIVTVYIIGPIALICLLIPKARNVIEASNLILIILSTVVLAVLVTYSENTSAVMHV
jgi:hypothetical protein